MSETDPAEPTPTNPGPKRGRGSAEAAREPAKRLLVWNTKRGVRQATGSTPAGVDPGGMQRHNLVQFHAYPGLSFCPAEHRNLLEPGLDSIDGLVLLRRGLEYDLPTQTAKMAIEQTGQIDVLTELAREVQDVKLQDAIAAQVAKVNREGPSGSRARDLQVAHARRV